MSPDRLGTALRDLVDDVEEGVAPPVADDLWAGGRRRRRTTRLVPVLAAACVAAVVGLLVWPTGHPRASVPAVQPDERAERLTAYPSAISKPPFLTSTDRPGVTAAVLAEASDTSRTYAVSPSGSVTHLVLPDTTPGQPLPALSPDGNWLARGPVLSDLVRGMTIPGLAAREALASSWMPSDHPAWWSPDSRWVYVDAFNQGEPKSSGLVVATDGSMTEVPFLVDNGRNPIVAGWLDEQTLLAFVDIGSGTTVLQGRTWRVGDAAWEVSKATIGWPPSDLVGTESSQYVRASLSPDRSRVLLTVAVTDPDMNRPWSSRAMMFDPVTGAQLGMPVGDEGVVDPAQWAPLSYVEWDGWGCRPAWHRGLPVVTDGGVRVLSQQDPGGMIGGPDPEGVLGGTVERELVSVSGRYDTPCVAFAGDELRGTPVADTWAVWQERAFEWGGRLLIVGLLVGGGWWARRQRR